MFKSKFKEEYVHLLREHLEKGFSFKSFAGVVRVRHSTIYRWSKCHDEFKIMKELLAKKKAKCENEV